MLFSFFLIIVVVHVVDKAKNYFCGFFFFFFFFFFSFFFFFFFCAVQLFLWQKNGEPISQNGKMADGKAMVQVRFACRLSSI